MKGQRWRGQECPRHISGSFYFPEPTNLTSVATFLSSKPISNLPNPADRHSGPLTHLQIGHTSIFVY
jgi:hypothetical protein